MENKTHKFPVTVISGSMRFWKEIQDAASEISKKGEIALVPWLDDRPEEERTEAINVLHVNMHHQRIEMADKMLVVNPGGYIGEYVNDEIIYAESLGLPIKYTDPQLIGKTITLIGSGKFLKEFAKIEVELSLKGAKVFTPAIFKVDDPLRLSAADHRMLDKVHRAKMESSNYVLVVNVNDYVGQDTREEIEWALERGVPVEYYYEHNYECKEASSDAGN